MIEISKGRYWDLPWSLVDGCTPCSPGCEHCWAAAIAQRFWHQKGCLTDTQTGQFNGKIITNTHRLDIPLKRRKPTVYAVWNDLFHEAVPPEVIFQTLACISLAPRHTFLVLTKRPERMHYILTSYGGKKDWRDILSKRAFDLFGEEADCFSANSIEGCLGEVLNVGWPMSNIYHGLTVCNQAEADKKVPVFLQVPGNKFLSIEPMLGEIKLRNYNSGSSIDAVILGGETGPGARPLHPDWVRSVRDQCQSAGVKFFFKGWGSKTFETQPDYLHRTEHRVRLGGRLLDGRMHDDLPWRQ